MFLNNIESIIKRVESVIDLSSAKLSEEYFYQSLPLCIIDSVFSIGVTYTSTRNTVLRYCKYFDLKVYREYYELPTIEKQESISQLIQKMKKIGTKRFAWEIFKNRQRTSSRNGILKSEAVLKFAEVLNSYEVEYFQDINKIINSSEFEERIKKIPGQKSGISLKYFFMLIGSNDLIKPDRMVLGFLKNCMGKEVKLEEAQILLSEASELLKDKYENMNPRLLDHEIWKYMSQ
ncbi:MAG: hypothetical protein FH753_02670 [Firmicutes bacterium]|nr:hypothetical protein [Bacillota bacterium]